MNKAIRHIGPDTGATGKRTLLVYKRGSHRTMAEIPYTFPYGDAEASIEPLRKLKPAYYGAILGPYGIAAVSADMPTDHPMYRAYALKVERS